MLHALAAQTLGNESTPELNANRPSLTVMHLGMWILSRLTKQSPKQPEPAFAVLWAQRRSKDSHDTEGKGEKGKEAM
jgi:hypothetical protein